MESLEGKTHISLPILITHTHTVVVDTVHLVAILIVIAIIAVFLLV